MRTEFEYRARRKSQRLADLRSRTEELERRLSDARVSLERELAQFAWDQDAVRDEGPQEYGRGFGDQPREREAGDISVFDGVGYSADDLDEPAGHGYGPQARTEALVSRGRPSAFRPGMSRGIKAAMAAGIAAIAITVLVVLVTGGSASWPAGVVRVQHQSAQACKNPDVKSEPGQLNFACAPSSRQILWIFSLLTSRNNPRYLDTSTGRAGLEPIKPSQGGEVAGLLNLHHPYSPYNPIDSLQVAARAINNIVAGATVTGADGMAAIQPGLESDPQRCARYTGSSALTSRKGFPKVCARPVATRAGQAALAADVFEKWVVGASPATAQDVATLFENANDPGNPQVQAILNSLRHQRGAG